jgi:hypothetical protein
MRIWVYVSTPKGDAPSQVGLGEATLMPTGLRTWLLQEGETVLAKVAEAILMGKIVSAYVGLAEMPAEKPWLAVEWHQQIVVDPELAGRIERLLPGWIAKPIGRAGVVVFSATPAKVAQLAKARSRSSVAEAEPRWWEIDFEDAQRDPVGWFGEFGRDTGQSEDQVPATQC